MFILLTIKKLFPFRIAVHSYSTAKRIANQIDYAKTLALEQVETLYQDADEEAESDRSYELEV